MAPSRIWSKARQPMRERDLSIILNRAVNSSPIPMKDIRLAYTNTYLILIGLTEILKKFMNSENTWLNKWFNPYYFWRNSSHVREL